MIEESNTINQLNLALNELLDEYDLLKDKNDSLLAENAQLKKEIEDLSSRNKILEKDISTLNNTTKHHTSEIDSMLGRIKSTLNTNIPAPKEEVKFTEEKKESENNSKEIDLGRMQSLLSGFNN